MYQDKQLAFPKITVNGTKMKHCHSLASWVSSSNTVILWISYFKNGNLKMQHGHVENSTEYHHLVDAEHSWGTDKWEQNSTLKQETCRSTTWWVGYFIHARYRYGILQGHAKRDWRGSTPYIRKIGEPHPFFLLCNQAIKPFKVPHWYVDELQIPPEILSYHLTMRNNLLPNSMVVKERRS